MESSRGQNGIQALLSAEQEAQHIVNAARTGKFFSCIKFFVFLTPLVMENSPHGLRYSSLCSVPPCIYLSLPVNALLLRVLN